MSDFNGLPPDGSNSGDGNPPSPVEFAPQNQPGMPPAQPGFMPQGGVPPMAPQSSGNGMKYGVLFLLIIMTLLIPLGLYKIGSPHPCTPSRDKAGECKMATAFPTGCTPSRFNDESSYLTCKMVGAIENEKFKESNPGKYQSCNELHVKIKGSGFKCYALPGLTKKDAKGKPFNGFKAPPLEVQKTSVLNSVSKGTLSQDFIFTILTMLLILGAMAVAAFYANKKNRDSFIWITGVFVVGIFGAYLYRYFVAGFYNSNIVVMLISLIGFAPAAVIIVGKMGKLGLVVGDETAPGDYSYQKVDLPPVPEEQLSKAEASKFEMMAMQNTPIMTKVFIIGFIGLVLTLIPIGLVSMGKTSKADSTMKKQAAKLSSLVKKKATEKTEDVDLGEDEEGSGEDSE